MNNITVILLCALVTAIPKIIPLKFLEGKRVSRDVADFLNIIPYTSLTILIIRGILTASPEMFRPTVAASIVALITARLKDSIGLTILSGVLVAFIMIHFFR